MLFPPDDLRIDLFNKSLSHILTKTVLLHGYNFYFTQKKWGKNRKYLAQRLRATELFLKTQLNHYPITLSGCIRIWTLRKAKLHSITSWNKKCRYNYKPLFCLFWHLPSIFCFLHNPEPTHLASQVRCSPAQFCLSHPTLPSQFLGFLPSQSSTYTCKGNKTFLFQTSDILLASSGLLLHKTI